MSVSFDSDKQFAAFEKVRQDFVANVSHELRTPLTVIRGYLEMLVDAKTIDQDKWRPIFGQMFAQSVRMESLIADLLFLSKLESGTPDVQDHVKLDVAGMLQSIASEANSLSASGEHQISLDCDEHLTLIGMHDELRSAFSNLVFNAVKYTPEKGDILIRWYQRDNQAIMSVSDTGIGIAEKHLPRLTERFYRVDKARSRDKGGTGLGLAIVKHVLIRHHANLEVSSVLGRGSEFRCVFDLDAGSGPA